MLYSVNFLRSAASFSYPRDDAGFKRRWVEIARILWIPQRNALEQSSIRKAFDHIAGQSRSIEIPALRHRKNGKAAHLVYSTRERPPGFRATVSICAQEDGRLERRVSGTQRHGTASTENKAQTMPEISVADFWVDDLSRLAGSPNDRSQYTQNFHSRIHDPVFLAIYGV